MLFILYIYTKNLWSKRQFKSWFCQIAHFLKQSSDQNFILFTPSNKKQNFIPFNVLKTNIFDDFSPLIKKQRDLKNRTRLILSWICLWLCLEAQGLRKFLRNSKPKVKRQNQYWTEYTLPQKTQNSVWTMKRKGQRSRAKKILSLRKQPKYLLTTYTLPQKPSEKKIAKRGKVVSLLYHVKED